MQQFFVQGLRSLKELCARWRRTTSGSDVFVWSGGREKDELEEERQGRVEGKILEELHGPSGSGMEGSRAKEIRIQSRRR